MPFAPLMSLPYPNEWSNPYWADFVIHANWMDEWFQALRENADFNIVAKGGSWALAAGSLSWDTAIVIVSSTDGGDLTIAAGALAIPADGVVYTTLPVRPLVGAQVGALSYAATLPVDVDYYVLGVVYGGVWYPRSELALTGMFSYGVYVDAVNGSDVTGDGTIQYPYQTLQVAYASVTTTNLAEFITPVQFVLRPGTYSGMGAKLPDRQYISVTGSRYTLTAQQYVEIDGTIPVTLANYTRYVVFSTDTPLQSYFGTSGSYFHVRRVNTGVGGAPGQGAIVLKNLIIDTGKILINPSGSANPNENTGIWRVVFDSCYQQPLSVFHLFGSYETPSNDLNRLDLFANNSILGIGPGARLNLRGVMGLGDIVGTNLKMDVSYFLDYNDVAYTGSIGGTSNAYVGLQASQINASINTAFGWDGVTPDAPDPIRGDSHCLRRLIEEGFTFTNFNSSGEVRDWAAHHDIMEYAVDWPADSTLIVPRGDTDVQSGENLIATYNRAKLLTPGGNPLSFDNRAVVLVPPGTYDIGVYSVSGCLVMDTDYVDLIGMTDGSPCRLPYADGGGNAVVPNVYIIGVTDTGPLVEQSAADIRMFNISLDSSAGGVARQTMIIRAANANSQYYNLYLNSNGASPAVEGVTGGGALVSVSGYWRNIRTPVALFPGEFSGIAEYCTAGDNSFGGYSGLGFVGVCSGSLYNCTAGNKSFGSSDFDDATFSGYAENCTGGLFCFGHSLIGDALCSGTLKNCVASDYSFGVTGDNTNTYSVIFSGSAYDCISGTNSFASGYNKAIAETFSGIAVRCTASNNSFASGYGPATCSGTFTECVSGSYSFGYSLDDTADCSGTLKRCVAELLSYGATGDTANNTGLSATFSGYAEDCVSNHVGGDCFSFGVASNPVNAAITATFSGTCKRCITDGNYSFGASGAGSTSVSVTAYFEDCVADDYAFGYSLLNTVNVEGTFRRCRAEDYSYGVSGDNTGTYSALFSGYAYDCVSGDYSFAVCQNAGLSATLGGELYRCTAGDYSYGWGNGTEGHCLNLYMEDCTAGEGSITSGVGLTQNSTFVRCKMIQAIDSSISVGTNTKFLDCQFSANNIVLLIVDDTITPQIYGCGLYSILGAAFTIAGTSDYDARIAHCRMNTDIDTTPGTSVTNLIVDGYNVLDSLFEVF